MSREVTSFRIKGVRTPQYGLLRQLPLGLNPRQRIYKILSTGSFEPFAELEFLSGGATLERMGTAARLYEGLPPYISFAAPSGFLGRVQAQAASATAQFPESLKDWDDEHKLAYLFTRAVNQVGNLVFGDAAVEREMNLRKAHARLGGDKAEHYEAVAMALKGHALGSSAGGEQPKFLATLEDVEHLIVKFAKLGTRMADLLPLEHLALRSLAEVGIPSSKTSLVSSGDFVFLEIRRFDRIGETGRVGMLSAGAVDDEFFGKRDTWSEFAARCEQVRYLSSKDVLQVDVMAAFSELIGNTDRHFENISLLIDERGEYIGIAPAYDILPMRYAPIGAGIDPDLVPIEPKVGTVGAKPQVWAMAAKAARRFWMAVQTEQLPVPISDDMRMLAAKNLDVAISFVAPLLPAGAS